MTAGALREGSARNMGHSIAVMNTKGGVGKSTLVMALAETLSAIHNKNVLVIDSDSQTSMSSMLMHIESWEQMERQHRTLVDYLTTMTLGRGDAQWTDFVARGVSDVEDARSVYLIPSHMELSLFEREVSAQRREAELRQVVRKLLDETMRMFDIVLIDCPPGLSLLTECWLREVEYFMPPMKPDYLAVRGLGILKKFRDDFSEQGFAELLGIVINMKDGRIASEDVWQARLMADPENRCFKTQIPRRAYIQRAADFDLGKRTYIAKYPGDAGSSIRAVTMEMLGRLGTNAAARTAAMAPAKSAQETAKAAAAARPVAAGPATAPSPVSAAAPPPTPVPASAVPAPAVASPPRPAVATLEASARSTATPTTPEPQGKIILGQVTGATTVAPTPTATPHLRVAAPLRPMPVRPPLETTAAEAAEGKAGK